MNNADIEKAAKMVAAMNSDEFADMKQKAMIEQNSASTKKAIQKLREKGFNRKKMMKKMKDAKKEAKNQGDETSSVPVEMIQCIWINESRKIKEISLNANDMITECKKILRTKGEIDELQCSNLSVGVLEDKRIKIYLDPSKNCETGGNRRTNKFLPCKNHGGCIFSAVDEDFPLAQFLEAEKSFSG